MAVPSSDSAAIRQAIRALIAAGYKLDSVDDGEEDAPVRNEREALDAITAVDEARLYVVTPEGTTGPDAVRAGTLAAVFFVLGNAPEEVMCDWNVSLSPVLDALLDKWCED